MSVVQNSAKQLLRASIKAKLRLVTNEVKNRQSLRVTEKIINMDAYKHANSVSVYLSTTGELNTIELLTRMFVDNKQVFVPTYEGDNMEMVQLDDMKDFESLPVTKWNIKQPYISENRANALDEDGLDLILLPGVAFSTEGGRCGHGRGYYDKYLRRYFEMFPMRYAKNMTIAEKVKNRKTVLIGLALKEQIVEKDELPLDVHDFALDTVLFDDE